MMLGAKLPLTLRDWKHRGKYILPLDTFGFMDYGKHFSMNFHSTASGSLGVNLIAQPTPNLTIFTELLLQMKLGAMRSFSDRFFVNQGFEYKEQDFSLTAAMNIKKQAAIVIQ